MEKLDDLISSANLSGEKMYRREGAEFVGMNQAKTIDVSQIHERRILETFGVHGCTLVAAFAKFSDGKMLAHMSHFDPGSISQQQIELSRLRQEDRVGPIIVKIITRGDYVKQGERWILVPQDQTEVSLLREAAGDAALVEVKAYSEGLSHGESREARFLLTPSADGSVAAQLQWWQGTERFD